MAEHVLRGTIGILPRPEGGRNVIVQEENGDIYRIPMPESLQHEVAEALGRSDEELAAEVKRQQSAERIVLPGRGRDAKEPVGASPNGQGRPGSV